MVIFGHGAIWARPKNTQKKISPSGLAQIHPVRPIDIPRCQSLDVTETALNISSYDVCFFWYQINFGFSPIFELKNIPQFVLNDV